MPGTKLICFDFDQTIVNGHFHAAMRGRGVRANDTTTGVQVLQQDGTFKNMHTGQTVPKSSGASLETIEAFLASADGLKNGAEMAQTIREAIDNGHKIAITSFTHYPEVVLPTLKKLGLEDKYIQQICIVGGYPSHGKPDGSPDGKEQHITAAIQHFNKQGVGLRREDTMLVDDSTHNISKVPSGTTVIVPRDRNPPPTYFEAIRKFASKAPVEELPIDLGAAPIPKPILFSDIRKTPHPHPVQQPQYPQYQQPVQQPQYQQYPQYQQPVQQPQYQQYPQYQQKVQQPQYQYPQYQQPAQQPQYQYPQYQQPVQQPQYQQYPQYQQPVQQPQYQQYPQYQQKVQQPQYQYPQYQQPVQQPQYPQQALPATKDGLFKVEPTDWAKAMQYFDRNPSATKCDKKANGLDCSFIKVGDAIYAIKTGPCLGEGAFGKVKTVQNMNGENFAVKVEGRTKRGDLDSEVKIMKMLGELQGEADRVYGKTFKGQYAQNKLYTVMKLKEGNELFEELYMGKKRGAPHKDLPDSQRLLLAIKAAEAIKVLHDKNIIHADIKPENFMANVKGENIVIGAIDFGFSMVLAPGQDKIIGTAKGSPLYCAPEIVQIVNGKVYGMTPATFSKASDIYSIGKMFEHDFGLKMGEDFYRRILNPDPKMRPTMPQLLDELYIKLAVQPNLNSEVKMMADNYLRERKINLQAFRDAQELRDSQVLTARVQSANSLGGLVKAINDYPWDIKNSQGIVMDKQKMIEAMTKILNDPKEVAAIVAAGGMTVNAVQDANLSGNHGFYRKFMSFVQAQHQLNLAAKDREEALTASVQSANNLEALVKIITDYPGDIKNSQGIVMDKQKMIEAMTEILHDPKKVEAIAAGGMPPSGVLTRNHGFYDKFISFAQEQHQLNRATQAREAALTASVQSANNLEALVKIINDYPGDIKNSQGVVMDKQNMIKAMTEILNDPKKVEAIDAGGMPPSGVLTSNHGFYDKFISFAKEQHQLNVAKDREAAQKHQQKALEGIENFLAKDEKGIKSLYEEHSRSQSSVTVGRWMSNLHKDAGKVVFGKGKEREAQIKLLSDCIVHLKDKDPAEKAQKIYAILTKIESEIGREHNSRESGMDKMIKAQKQNLETAYPALKEPGNAAAIQRAGAAILREVRPAEEVKENSKQRFR